MKQKDLCKCYDKMRESKRNPMLPHSAASALHISGCYVGPSLY